MSPVVEVADLARSYGTDGLQPVSFALHRGELVAVTGSSGSGKTTLLNVLGLLDRHTAGSYLLDGKDVGTMRGRGRRQVRSRLVGFAFQQPHLVPYLTAAENVELGLALAGWDRSARRDWSREFMESVGLDDKIMAPVGTLSGGQQQRVAVIRAVAHHPLLLLADEPTGSLDDPNADLITDLLVDAARRGQAVLVVTHSARVAQRADRRIPLNGH